MRERFLAAFTIVELLIVIAVLIILSSVAITQYNGYKQRANNTNVQTDLTKFAEAINVYYSDNAVYPANSAALTTLTAVKFTKASYMTSGNAVLYCVASSGGQTMALLGKSSSGTTYYVLNDERVKTYTAGTFPNATPANNCTDVGVASATTVWVHSTASGWLSNV
ncbi:MAG TPA: type II secretion system protein GspG [Candidatus Saccharibacteria bacterium]|nr:type II secretion system protein GspG [Candidatus Saccharibacteria bacterium]HRK94443.1 type II secretion system protein GspG [Candidatus Saccharibacteria bacterium]